MSQYARAVDLNHKPIVDGLRAHGYAVLNLSGVGKGCPDILVGYVNTTTVAVHMSDGGWKKMQMPLPMNILFEIKNPSARPHRKKAPAQQAFRDAWPGPCFVIESLDEALAILQEKR